MVNFFHSAYIEDFRSAVGGLALGDPLTLRILVSDEYYPHISSVALILTKDDEQPVSYQLTPSAYRPFDGITYPILSSEQKITRTERDFGKFFETSLNITTSGLYFYHFEISFIDGSTTSIGRNRFYNAEERSNLEWELVVFEQPFPKIDLQYSKELSAENQESSAENQESSVENQELSAKNQEKSDIIYQIFTDRFCIGDKRNKTKNYAKYRDDWGGIPDYGKNGEFITNTDFFGGNLSGITSKLEYLKSLNVTMIYLNPIFEARSSHKYDTANYFRIDPDFGSDEDFSKLIKKAKSLGIGVILDGVFSHTGDDSIYFNKYGNYDSLGAYESENSPYYDWYSFESFPNNYSSWWGIDTLPEVNENNKHYTEFVCGHEGVLRHWLKKGVSGWRLDVADELPNEFLDNVRFAVKRENPAAMIIGEVWENAATKISYDVRKRYFSSCQLDSVTNYPLKNAIISFVKGGDANELAAVILELISTYPKQVLNRLMNILGTHDTVRIRTVFGSFERTASREDRANAVDLTPDVSRNLVKLAAVIQFTLFGIPCIYYGDEAGLGGFEDPFNRRCYEWGNEDTELLDFYRKLTKIRCKNGAIFSSGKTRVERAQENILIYTRELNNKTITIALNLSDEDYDLGKLYRTETQTKTDPSDESHEANKLHITNKTDLLTGKAFTGIIKKSTALILE